MSRAIPALLALTFSLAACAPSAAEIAATAQVLAETIIAEAQAAVPSSTNMNTARPSNTPTPSQTETLKPTATHTFTPAPSATATAPLDIRVQAPSLTPVRGSVRVARLRFENNTDEIILVIFTSHNHEQYSFEKSWNLQVTWGDYDYVLWIGNDGPYAGSFTIKNPDKHTLEINPGRVKFHYP